MSKQLLQALLAFAFLTTPTVAEETLTIVLADGRSVAGKVDPATDGNRLWLRRENDVATLASAFSWNDVIQGSVDRRALFGNDVRTWALMNPSRSLGFRDLKGSTDQVFEPNNRHAVAPIATLVVEAILAQWDNDSQADGLRVFVSPLDGQGRIVPVQGQIDFTLVTETDKLSDGQSRSLVPTFIELERSSRIVRRSDFARGPAVYEVPFTGRHPEFDMSLAPQALLHARLGIPGRGVFEASDAQVIIRECNRFRDQLQYYTPGRQLPLESGGQQNR